MYYWYKDLQYQLNIARKRIWSIKKTDRLLKEKNICHVETRFTCFPVAIAMRPEAQHLRRCHFCFIWTWRMTRCLVNRVLHTDCVIQASVACALQMHTLSLLLYHTYPHRICSQNDESCTNSVMRHLRSGQRVKREHKQERPECARNKEKWICHTWSGHVCGRRPRGPVSNGWPQGRTA